MIDATTIRPSAQLISVEHSAGLIFLSFVVSVLGSALAVHLTDMIRPDRYKKLPVPVRVSGALLLGGGVWSMHFIAMLAMELGVVVSYNLWILLASMVPVFLGSYIAFGSLVSGSKSSVFSLGAPVIGLSIGVMHYSGMFAMQMTATMHFDYVRVAMTAFAAVGLTALALSSSFLLQRKFTLEGWVWSITCGSAIGIAATITHHLGMSSVTFFGIQESATPIPAANHGYLVAIIILVLILLSDKAYSGSLAARLEFSDQVVSKQKDYVTSSEKLATIGSLTAGITHEISNPLSFVVGNISAVGNLFRDLFPYVDMLRRWKAEESLSPQQRAELDRLINEAPLDQLEDEVHGLLTDVREGCSRITGVVQKLSEFSRIRTDAPSATDVNECIQSALTLVSNQLGENHTVHLDLGDIPKVQAQTFNFTQSILSLILNAADAIADDGSIRISTESKGGQVVVRITDNGTGIPQENLQRIFDPFFTTKAPNRGIGMGLALLSRSIEACNGVVNVSSTIGKGTTFEIKIPHT